MYRIAMESVKDGMRRMKLGSNTEFAHPKEPRTCEPEENK